MNKARLEWHRENQRSRNEYFRKLNHAKMAEWAEVNENVDRSDPAVCVSIAEAVSDRAVRLLKAANVLDDPHRREGALKRAGRFIREAVALEDRAARLRRGEKPLDEWAVCACGSAFQPGGLSGVSTYTRCYTCSSKDWFLTSLACIFCSRRHSMSYPLCFSCKQDRDEDDARFLRTMTCISNRYTCQMCGIDAMETGVELQIHRINPEGGNWPWNREVLCSACSMLAGKSYDKLDERAYWALVQIYAESLWEYLSPDEQAALLAIEPDTDHEQVDFGHLVPWPDLGDCDERDGILNVLASFDAQVTA